MQKIWPQLALQQQHQARAQMLQKAPRRAGQVEWKVTVANPRTVVLADQPRTGGCGAGQHQWVVARVGQQRFDQGAGRNHFADRRTMQHDAALACRSLALQTQALAPAQPVAGVLAAAPPQVQQYHRGRAMGQQAVGPGHAVHGSSRGSANASGRPPTAWEGPGGTICR